MRLRSDAADFPGAHGRCVLVLFTLLIVALLAPLSLSALTVRTKSDLRLWETVTDRSRPLAWPWEEAADVAELTFSNRLTRAVTATTVVREAGARRGSCPHPVEPAIDEALVVMSLVQKSGGAVLSCETAEIAYVPGASGRPLTVRTKAGGDWYRVPCPRLAAFDASWWNAVGPSGYEVVWASPRGKHRVVREFDGAGVVDEIVLKFGEPGFCLSFR